jgi:hypothetical protein
MTKLKAVRSALKTRGLDRLLDAAKAVKRVFTRKQDTQQFESAPQPATSRKSKHRGAKKQTATQPERIIKRETDIPFDIIDRYTPSDTSSKASFRSDGSDHYGDQEMAFGVVDERWNDEDRLTNRSGDPRIGTHRRTYEPEEARQ